MKISVYARNFNIDPSTYYGVKAVNRYVNDVDFRYRCLIPDGLFIALNKKRWNGLLAKYFRYIILGVVSYFRTFVFITIDKIIYKPETIYVNREVFPHFAPPCLFSYYLSLLKHKNIIWRYDDNIFIHEITDKESTYLFEHCRALLVSNDYLRSIVPDVYQNKLVNKGEKLVGDPDIDKKRVLASRSLRVNTYITEVRLIWLGSSSGISFLSEVLPSIEDAAKELKSKGKRLKLIVVSDRPLEEDTENLCIENICWERQIAIEELYKAHIGLMPLPDTKFSRGKSAFKLTQYKCAGLPSIASDLPIHKEKLHSGDGIIVPYSNQIQGWRDAIVKLSCNVDYWCEMSDRAIMDVERNYLSREDIMKCYSEVYRNG